MYIYNLKNIKNVEYWKKIMKIKQKISERQPQGHIIQPFTRCGPGETDAVSPGTAQRNPETRGGKAVPAG